jgi:hypothetical protein
VVGLLVASVAATAAAQEQTWLKDRRYREGMGYRAGDLEIHPGVAGEFGYDSNMFLRGSKDVGQPIIDVIRLRLTPSLSVSTLGPQRRGESGEHAEPPKVNFRAGVSGTYNEYIATKGDYGSQASQFRNVGAMANFNLEILPNRPWGMVMFGDLTRTVQPSNLSDLTAAYNRINADAGAEIVWAPGGGLFDWRLGYRFDTTLFEKELFKQLNNVTHTLNTRGRWRFLPRTALMYDASQGFVRYADSTSKNFLLDSDPLRARVGMTGLITSYFGFLGMFGWGATFLKPGQVPQENYDGAIGQAQFTFYPTPAPGLADSPHQATLALSQIGLGYTRDFASSYLGSHYTRDRGYLNGSFFFAGRFLLVAEAGVARVHFPTLYFKPTPGAPTAPAVRTGAFNEMRVDTSLFAEYRFADSLGVNMHVSYDMNSSITAPTDRAAPADPNRVDDLSWKRFQAYLGVRWFM